MLQQLGANRGFADAMDAQLGAQARQLAGIDLLDGRFSILPGWRDDGRIEYELTRRAPDGATTRVLARPPAQVDLPWDDVSM